MHEQRPHGTVSSTCVSRPLSTGADFVWFFQLDFGVYFTRTLDFLICWIYNTHSAHATTFSFMLVLYHTAHIPVDHNSSHILSAQSALLHQLTKTLTDSTHSVGGWTVAAMQPPMLPGDTSSHRLFVSWSRISAMKEMARKKRGKETCKDRRVGPYDRSLERNEYTRAHSATDYDAQQRQF